MHALEAAEVVRMREAVAAQACMLVAAAARACMLEAAAATACKLVAAVAMACMLVATTARACNQALHHLVVAYHCQGCMVQALVHTEEVHQRHQSVVVFPSYCSSLPEVIGNLTKACS